MDENVVFRNHWLRVRFFVNIGVYEVEEDVGIGTIVKEFSSVEGVNEFLRHLCTIRGDDLITIPRKEPAP